MRARLRRALGLAAWVALAGCAAPSTRVVLLPQADNPGTAVVLTPPVASATGAGSTLLNVPYQSATLANDRAAQVEQLDARQVRERYGQLLDSKPEPVLRFTLYFQPGTSNLTAESTAELAKILELAKARAGGEIFIVGHTDTVGTVESNDALSLRRARAIRESIVQRGFDAARVDAAGRGERAPVVPTADEVDEPKNRRAEVEIR